MVELEEQLRSYGSALDTLIDGDAAAPSTAGPAHRSKAAPLAAAGLLAASIIGVAAMVVNRDPEPVGSAAAAPSSTSDTGVATATLPESSTDTTPETAPATAPGWVPDDPTDASAGWPAIAVAACLEDVETYPTDFGARPTAADPTTIIPIGDGTSARITIRGPETSIACTVTAAGTGTSVSDVSFGSSRPRLPVTADGVVVDDQSWMSETDEGRTGPGWYEVSGRAGSDVVGVTIVMPDGSTAPVSLSEGNFYGRIDIGSGVALFEEVLTWTLVDGTVRSDRSDLVDDVSAEEQCASTEGCVEQRIAQLRSNATGVVAEVLDDGEVTEDEYRAALQRVADCANAAGGQVEVIGSTLSVGGDTAAAVLDPCQAEHLVVIAEARALLDARDRMAGS